MSSMEFRFTPQRICRRLAVEIYENGGLYKREHKIRASIFWSTLGVLWILDYACFLVAFLAAFAVYFCCGGWKYMLLIYNTLFRDLRALYGLMKMKLQIRAWRKKNWTVGHVFQRLVKRHPHKACLLHEDKTWTFKEVDEYSNQVANCFSELGFQRGDDVALFMESRPEFIGLWLGLSKVGVVPALINSNLRLEPLRHSVTDVSSKAVIFGAELAGAVREVAPLLQENTPEMQFFCFGDAGEKPVFPARTLDHLIRDSPASDPQTHNKAGMDDRLFYVYTSGTTGLPKAAIIRHSRFMWLGVGIHFQDNLTPDDILYTALPLYHTAGGILSLSQTMLFGSTLAIRSRFSASKFWDDCIKFEATAAQYIGEMCRYLLAQPEKPQEREHRVRIMFGNGLRPQIWKSFVRRFGISRIGEFYGSTEGNANVVNTDNKVGAVGFMSRIIPTVYPVTLIRVDPVTGDPVRNKKGLCIRCEPGEPGEFVGKIIPNNPERRFDGYVNENATKKKIIRDCFQKGDMAFLSGDMLVMDEDGYLFFMDRTGDTFRWKGENVSTMEVEGVISKVLHHADSVVYGVKVGESEGRAGMAALCDPDRTLDPAELQRALSAALPSYAVPQFLRLCEHLESTGTFKLKKVDLQKDGFDPERTKDPLYYLDKKQGTYSPIDSHVYQKICTGQIRL